MHVNNATQELLKKASFRTKK